MISCGRDSCTVCKINPSTGGKKRNVVYPLVCVEDPCRNSQVTYVPRSLARRKDEHFRDYRDKKAN